MDSPQSNMDLLADFKSFQDLIQSSLVNVTRSATQVSNQDLSFHRSSSEKLSRSLDRQNAHLLRLTNKLLKAATQDTHRKPAVLQNQDDIEDNWRGVVDVVDDLLEKADSALDEFSGAIKRGSPAPQDATSNPKSSKFENNSERWNSHVMQKPQQFFDRKINNSDATPFKPLLQSKPHATVPLADSIGNDANAFKHPYAQEIEDYTYPDCVYQHSPPIPFASADASEPIYVDTEEGVKEMLEELKAAKEIAVDLEHNDLRSYIGMVCLMQISTREKDWIVDTLKPWREKLQMLNEVFADPKILKVFHGSNMDIIWLQRDLGLYVVGLFDTFHAASALQFPGKGLKHLLLQFANFKAQKQYQTADWRVRPLPAELVDYARSDTHYLLNIYDHLRNMLVEASSINVNLTDFVLAQSKKEALQVYKRPIYDMEFGGGQLGWFGLLSQRPVRFANEQFGVFRALHAWRDRKAREVDEGIQYILPNQTLWLLADKMPTSAFNFHQLCRGQSKRVLDRVPELIEVVKQGKNEGRDGKSMQEALKQSEEVLGLTLRRPRRERKEPETTTIQGVGATLQQLASSGEVASVNQDRQLEVEMPIAIRSSASAFWGVVVPQHQQLSGDAHTASDALASILPLPVVTAEKVEEKELLQNTSQAERTASVKVWKPLSIAAQSQLRSKASEIFTLKEISNSKKRKADDADEADEASPQAPALSTSNGAGETTTIDSASQPSTPNPDFESKRLTKKQKKAEKKARREAERLAAEAKAQEMQPFDYANAESLLTPSAQTTTAQDQAAKRMNPFAKALDASTGARRSKMGKELAGKSMTFNS